MLETDTALIVSYFATIFWQSCYMSWDILLCWAEGNRLAEYAKKDQQIQFIAAAYIMSETSEKQWQNPLLQVCLQSRGSETSSVHRISHYQCVFVKNNFLQKNFFLLRRHKPWLMITPVCWVCRYVWVIYSETVRNSLKEENRSQNRSLETIWNKQCIVIKLPFVPKFILLQCCLVSLDRRHFQIHFIVFWCLYNIPAPAIFSVTVINLSECAYLWALNTV